MPDLHDLLSRAQYDDAAARELCTALRWPDGVISDPRSGARAIRCKHRRHRWVLSDGQELSVTASTLLAGSHVPLRRWVQVAVALTSAAPVSTAGLAQRLGLRRATLHDMAVRLRAGVLATGAGPLRGTVAVGLLRLPVHDRPFALFATAWRGTMIHQVRIRLVAGDLVSCWTGFFGDHVHLGAVVAAWPELAELARRLGYRTQPRGRHARAALARVRRGLAIALAGAHSGALAQRHLQGYLNLTALRLSHAGNPGQAACLLLAGALQGQPIPTRQLRRAGHGWDYDNPQPAVATAAG